MMYLLKLFLNLQVPIYRKPMADFCGEGFSGGMDAGYGDFSGCMDGGYGDFGGGVDSGNGGGGTISIAQSLFFLLLVV